MDHSIWITLVEPKKPSEPREKGGLFSFREEEKPRKVVNIRISFPGANPNARLKPFGRLDTVVSYFIGNDPAKWRVAVPVWSGVRYRGLYPGGGFEGIWGGDRLGCVEACDPKMDKI